MRKPDKQLHTVIEPPGQQNVRRYATMAVSEDPLWNPLVYAVEDIATALDVQVFTISFPVTLYYQCIARAGREIRRELRVHLECF